MKDFNFCCDGFKEHLLTYGIVFYDIHNFNKWVCRFYLGKIEFIRPINNCPWQYDNKNTG